MQIKELSAKAISDSRGKPTIEVSINGQKASSPSGTSAGKHETPSFHKNIKWNIKAINNLKELKEIKINGFADLHIIENIIKQKFKFRDVKQFGANALFALESAILKALAKHNNKELWEIINPNAKRIPIPLGNAVGGGLHSHNSHAPTFQEFLLIPKAKTIKENVKIMHSIYNKLKSLVKAKGKNYEGAWQTQLNEEEILKILSKFKNTKIGIDVAASSFYCDNSYCYNNNKSLDKEMQIKYINSLISDYNILYIEDPLQEEDFSGFSKIRKKALVCGDDLTVTHLDRLQKAIKKHSINSIIIKPNQNGSLLELHEIIKLCKRNKIKIILSHRSGETMDSAIADYAFAFQTDFIKCGISTPFREVKLNRLIEIEKGLN